MPLNPEAQVRNSFTTVPGAPTYDSLVAENGSAEYEEVDIEGAQALLEGAGVTGPIDVRFLFAANNPRRESEYELFAIRRLRSASTHRRQQPDVGPGPGEPDLYDASLFGWISTSVDIAGTNAQLRHHGQNNPHGYSNPEGR